MAAGNALQLFLDPPAGAERWRVLRKGTDSFKGPDDTDAVVLEGDARHFIDTESLKNDQAAFYRPFYWINGAWVAGETNHGTPTATYEDHSTDTVSFLRDRLERGLLVECERGDLSAELGYVQVYTAPPSLDQNIRWPLVTVQLDGEGQGDRAIGEDIGDSYFDDDGWFDSEGYLAFVKVSIVAWALNSDERIDLRKALRRILVANLPVLDGSGFQQVEFTFSDHDAVSGEFNAPVYQALCNFQCLAPVRVSHRVGTITSVTSTLHD